MATTRVVPQAFFGVEAASARTSRLNPKRAVILSDIGAVLGGMVLSTALYLAFFTDTSDGRVRDFAIVCALSTPVWVVGFVRNRLYSARFITRGIDESRRVFRGVVTGVIGLALADVVSRQQLERGWYVTVFVSVLLLVSLERMALRRLFDRWRMAGHLQRRVLIVGDNEEATQLYEMLVAQPKLGYLPVAQIPASFGISEGQARSNVAVGAGVDQLMSELRDLSIDSVLVAASATDVTTSNALIRALTEGGIHVELSSTLLDVDPERLTVRPLGGFPVVYIEPVHRNGWRAAAKRTFDIVLAGAVLAVTAPIWTTAALLVKITSPGPALFRQKRVGRDGEIFLCYKIRTMVADAESMLVDLADDNESDGPLFKMRKDPRVTPVGRFLRKTSIDELPQLWNVIRGEMSMVGPRPALPAEVERWPSRLHARLRVQPGLTGMWQVSGRSSAAFEDYIRLDLYYVDNWTLLTDLAIVVRTIPAVLRRDGAF